jgi:hypothetical protein
MVRVCPSTLETLGQAIVLVGGATEVSCVIGYCGPPAVRVLGGAPLRSG